MYRNYGTSSGKKTVSTQITTLPGAVLGIDVNPPDMCDSTITIYDSNDGTTAGKNIVTEIKIDAGLASVNHEYNYPVAINEGIYVDLTTTGTPGETSYIVRFLVG